MKNKIFNLVGLARKAGKIAAGMSMLEKAARQKKFALILIAEDTTQNTIEKVSVLKTSCRRLVFGRKEEWGEALGREQVAVIGILDTNFADGILRHYDESPSQ